MRIEAEIYSCDLSPDLALKYTNIQLEVEKSFTSTQCQAQD
eukprot:UN04241